MVRSGTLGLALQIRVTGPVRVTEIEVGLIGSPDKLVWPQPPGQDGQGVTYMGGMPQTLGTFELYAQVKDERGCVGRTGVRRFVTVVP